MTDPRRASLLVSLFAVACGGSVTTAPPTDDAGGTTDSVAGDAPIDGTVDAPADTPLGGCPAAVPSGGGKCDRVGLACEYATDPRVSCHVVATCTGSGWKVDAPTCPPLPAATCPPTRDAAAGQACTPTGAFCDYSGLVCECTNCIKYPIERCDGPVTWHCDAPNMDATCPAARPLLGTPCGKDGQQCNYGCEPGVSRRCEMGVWVSASAPGGCPVSARDAKTEISYLSPGAVDVLASEALDLKLATWRYKDKALGARKRVGIIVEDAPDSPAVDKEKAMVDLYGYSTMAIAAAQSQAKRIDALEKEIQALREALAKQSCAK